MADPDQVAQAFCQHYYGVFDSDRSQLGNLYSDESMLTFEDKRVKGVQTILQTLVGMGFSSIRHIPKTIDAQPSLNNGVLVFVSGDLSIDGSPNLVKFSQVFNLQPQAAGSFYILNDMFRMNYG